MSKPGERLYVGNHCVLDLQNFSVTGSKVSIVVGHQHKSSHQLLAEPIVCGAVFYALLQPFRFCSQSVIVPNVKVIGRELKRLQPRPVYHLKLSDQALSKRPSVQMPC